MSEVVTHSPFAVTVSGPERRQRPHEPSVLRELYFVVVLAGVLVLTTVPANGRPLGTRLVVAGLLAALTPLAYMTLRLKPAHGFVAALAFTPAATDVGQTGGIAGLGFLPPFGAITLARQGRRYG